jgi:hypothetical protein
VELRLDGTGRDFERARRGYLAEAEIETEDGNRPLARRQAVESDAQRANPLTRRLTAHCHLAEADLPSAP